MRVNFAPRGLFDTAALAFPGRSFLHFRCLILKCSVMDDLKELKQVLSELSELITAMPTEILITDEFECDEAPQLNVNLERIIQLLGYIQDDIPKLEKLIRRLAR